MSNYGTSAAGKRLVKAFGLTADDLKTVAYAANAVWNEIGYDILTAVAEESNGRKNSIPRSHVLELVLDADRMRDFLPKPDARTPAIVALFKNFYGGTPSGADLVEKFLKAEVFLYAWYGM